MYDERPTARLVDQDVSSLHFVIFQTSHLPLLSLSPSFLSQMVGHLNYDVWNWIVGYTVDDMRFKRSFPNFPDVCLILLSSLRVSSSLIPMCGLRMRLMALASFPVHSID